MNRILLVITFLFVGEYSFSQDNLRVHYRLTPDSVCGYILNVDSISGGNPPYNYNIWDLSVTYSVSGPACIPSGTDLYMTVWDSDCKYAYMNINVGNTLCDGLGAAEITYETTPGACDGALTVPVIPGAPLPLICIAYDATVEFLWDTITSLPHTFTNVCFPAGGYHFSLNFYDITATQYHSYSSYDLDTLTCGGEMSVVVYPFSPSDSLLCDGGAVTYVYGGTPPYTYDYSTGSSLSSETNICPGYHTVDVYDVAGHIVTMPFIVPEYNSYVYDTLYWLPEDTLYTNAYMLCGLDYLSPVDSVAVDTFYFSSPSTMVVSWNIYQDTSVFSLDEEYYLDTTTSPYAVVLSVYCEYGRSLGSYSFFAEIDPFGIVTNVQKPQVVTSNGFYAFPNPSNGLFKVHLEEHKYFSSGTIFDAYGRMVKEVTVNSPNLLLDLSGCNNGIYFLKLNGKQNQSIRLVKY